MDSGARIDTYNDDEDDYGDDYGDEDAGARRGFGDLADEDKLSVNLDDIEDNDSDEEAIDLSKGANSKPEVSAEPSLAMDSGEETKDENNTSGSDDQNKSTGGSSGTASTGNLFAVGESTDKGLADMETGSEVYMSELLVSNFLHDRLMESNCGSNFLIGWIRHGRL